MGKVVKIEDRIGDIVAREPAEDALHEGLVADRQCGLRANQRQRTEAGSQTRGQHERWNHSALNTMFVPVRPNSSRCLMKRPR